MTVIELIELLSECDPDAEVRIMMQENYPFEVAVRGIAVRSDFVDEPEEADEDETPYVETDFDGRENKPNDVFIVEGRQLAYGDSIAWEVIRHA